MAPYRTCKANFLQAYVAFYGVYVFLDGNVELQMGKAYIR